MPSHPKTKPVDFSLADELAEAGISVPDDDNPEITAESFAKGEWFSSNNLAELDAEVRRREETERENQSLLAGAQQLTKCDKTDSASSEQ